MSSSGWCTVQGCPGRPHDAYFRFPIDKAIYGKWLKVCKSPKSKKPIAWVISSRVCSLHFTHDDYDTEDDLAGNLKLKSLKSTAIPSIFPWSELWPLKKKNKKAAAGVNDKKLLESQKKAVTTSNDQPFSCTSSASSTENIRSWQNHCRNHGGKVRHRCDQCDYSTDNLKRLEIHFSRDHGGSTTDGSASPVLKKRSIASPDAGKTAGRASACRKAIKEKRTGQKESGSSGTSTSSVLSESDDSYTDNNWDTQISFFEGFWNSSRRRS